MATNELISYIKGQLDAGTDKSHIISVLQSQGGWELADITEAFLQIEQARKPQELRGVPDVSMTSAQPDNNFTQETSSEEVFPEQTETTTQQQSVLDNNITTNDNIGSENVFTPHSILGQAETQQQNTGRKFGAILALVVVFLVVCAGAVYGYFEYIQKPPTAHQLLGQVIIKNEEVTKTTTIKDISNLNLKLGIFGNNKGEQASLNLKILSDFVYNLANPTQPIAEGSLMLTASVVADEEEMNLQGTIDVKIVNQKVYFRLREIIQSAGLSILFDINPYTNKWVEFDLTLGQDLFGQDLAFLADEKLTTNKKLQEKILQIFNQFLSDSEIIEIVNRSGQVESVENTKGEKEYLLTFQPTKEDWGILIQKLYKAYKAQSEELIQLSLELSGTQEGWGRDEEEEIQEIFTEIEKQLASKEAEKIFEVLENLSVEMWVDKKTMNLRKSTVLFNVQKLKIPNGYENVKLDVSFSGTSEKEYGVPVEVVVPTNVVTLNEIIEEDDFCGGACQIANRNAVKATLQVVQAQSALYYDHDDHNLSYGAAKVASNLCSDDLFGDMTTRSVISEAENAGSGIGTAICAIGVGGQTWAVSVGYKVPTAGGETSWCTDSTSYAGDDAEKDTATMETEQDIAVCGPGI